MERFKDFANVIDDRRYGLPQGSFRSSVLGAKVLGSWSTGTWSWWCGPMAPQCESWPGTIGLSWQPLLQPLARQLVAHEGTNSKTISIPRKINHLAAAVFRNGRFVVRAFFPERFLHVVVCTKWKHPCWSKTKDREPRSSYNMFGTLATIPSGRRLCVLLLRAGRQGWRLAQASGPKTKDQQPKNRRPWTGIFEIYRITQLIFLMNGKPQ